MCTVSFVPKHNNNFVLTSNRDEQLKRKSAILPQFETINGVNILYPKDGEKGGTWIGVTDNNRVICLLNGAFEKHNSTPPYAKSRGIVVKDFLVCNDIVFQLNQYNLDNIEPFTLVIVDYYDKLKLIEFRWDGTNKYLSNLDEKSVHIWSSCTLYSKSESNYKSKEFKTHITPKNNSTDIFNFHEFGSKTEPLLMKYTGNPNYKTVSITQIEKTNNFVEMTYKNLLNKEIVKQNIKSKVCKKVEL
jgi:putative lipoic acid-binding regulatory protein